MSGLRAILVCVDYADLLAVTLPYNRHHFDEVLIVTSYEDVATVEVAEQNSCRLYQTAAFWDGGADFNKWRALEEGLDWFGRRGWICIMDADVLWPKEVKITPGGQDSLDLSGPGMTSGCSMRIMPGTLVTPRRRMAPWPHPAFAATVFPNGEGTAEVLRCPPEDLWKEFPLHPQQREFAGYTQIFHADDPVLGDPPWHEVDWRHAGGADSFFQAKWAEANKVRPPFEVLHLGPSGVNWCGVSEEARGKLKGYLRDRRRNRDFRSERLG